MIKECLEGIKTDKMEESWKNEYQEHLPDFERLKNEAEFIIIDALKKADIKVHSTPSRIKKIDSIIKKARAKKFDKPFEQMYDIVGMRIVCLFLSDINLIGNLIRENFRVIHEDNKIDGMDASSFGYFSVHFTVTLKEELNGPRHDGILGKPFEIQVRTISMDSWANIAHYLDYKTDVDVPTELKRDFYALSALLYVADTHFQMIFEERRKLIEKLNILIEPQEEINLDSLGAYLRKALSDREPSEPKYVSEIIDELLGENCKYIKDVEFLIKKYPLEKYVLPLDAESGIVSTDVGVIRSLLVAKKIDEINEVIKSWKPLPPKPANLQDQKPFVRIGGGIASYLMKLGDNIKIRTTNVGDLEIANYELGNRIGTGLPYLRRLMERLEPFHTYLLSKAEM
ncbi:Region found in RelA / SpoT proteins [uncultured archaeon]|nr:Region found in RelA / SpoT proteins [uncultured archaeon]